METNQGNFEDNAEDQVDDTAEQVDEHEGHEESSEDKARRLGWKPKEEYKGKGEWTDADSFLEKAENDPQALKKSLRTIERKYTKLEKNTEAILQHQQRQLEAAQKQAYAQAKAELEARLEDAIESGDKDAARKTLKAKEALDERERQDTKPQVVDNQKEVVDSWMEKNSWYKSDPRLRATAKQIEGELALDGVPLAERLERTTQLIKEEFPNKFRQTRQAPSMLGGGNNITRGRPKPGSYEALTAEARAECDRSVKGSNGKITKEDWLQYASPDMFQ